MPTYVYECTNKKCGHKFEDIHSFDAPSPVCEKCGGACKRIPSFNGGGLFGDTPKFYRNRR